MPCTGEVDKDHYYHPNSSKVLFLKRTPGTNRTELAEAPPLLFHRDTVFPPEDEDELDDFFEFYDKPLTQQEQLNRERRYAVEMAEREQRRQDRFPINHNRDAQGRFQFNPYTNRGIAPRRPIECRKRADPPVPPPSLLKRIQEAQKRKMEEEEEAVVQGEDPGCNSSTLKKRMKVRRGLHNLDPVPSEKGRELMASGDFGHHEFPELVTRRRRRGLEPPEPLMDPDPPEDLADELPPQRPLTREQTEAEEDRCRRPRMSLSKRLLLREMGIYDGEPARRLNTLMVQSMIPTSTEQVIHYDSRCYSGQFSDDGEFFVSCSQDMRVRLYNTSDPWNWKFTKSADYPGGYWTITDAALSPDNRHLAYSSLNSTVYLTRTSGPNDGDAIPLDFSSGAWNTRMPIGTPIWSIRFSGDGRELIAGAKDDSIYAYDIETRQPTLKLTGHTNDVNAVCYGDKNSPHIIFSGSDDTTIKIWDRRSMADGREAGAFLGHMEGLTYIDSKGDGRYILSNAKDQTMKLWDIRKLTERSTYSDRELPNDSQNWDYRFETYDRFPIRKHESDTSVVTFRGHRVLKTLIRCHFSPEVSSGSRYVYTGSEDGRVFIYNIDGTIAGVIDVQANTFDHRPQDPYSWRGLGYAPGRTHWDTCTRDVSWHPNVPLIASTSWNGYSSNEGTVAIHGYDGKIRGEDMTPDDFAYWNPTRRGLRICDGACQIRPASPDRWNEEMEAIDPEPISMAAVRGNDDYVFAMSHGMTDGTSMRTFNRLNHTHQRREVHWNRPDEPPTYTYY
ncbi:Beta-TrCP [Drechslerella dactyloides]|uniref:Beta-TrCP n=1 Tax=Drechslerella dactyloides TaxID=74499 RepID=A0AAD6NMK7_DREDA|nr:Beta-TrCP [Drechslerella dactyloides]